MLLGGLNHKTVLDTLRNEGDEGEHLETVVQPGLQDINCVESVDPGTRDNNQGMENSKRVFEKIRM